jgi:hypothetical protein
MPAGRRNLTCLAFASVAVAINVSGCAGADHTWRGEFDARLEGASAAVKRYLPELQSTSGEEELFFAGMELGRTLWFKTQLVAALEPPEGCELVQRKGKSEVYGLAELAAGLFKDTTPELKRALPVPFEVGVEKLDKFQREAAHCATG